jgi:hypothetical protein
MLKNLQRPFRIGFSLIGLEPCSRVGLCDDCLETCLACLNIIEPDVTIERDSTTPAFPLGGTRCSLRSTGRRATTPGLRLARPSCR